jgi:hypothetical protein
LAASGLLNLGVSGGAGRGGGALCRQAMSGYINRGRRGPQTL